MDHQIDDLDDDDLIKYINDVLTGRIATETRLLTRGRVGHWDSDRGVVVIEDGKGGTVFKPEVGERYFHSTLQ